MMPQQLAATLTIPTWLQVLSRLLNAVNSSYHQTSDQMSKEQEVLNLCKKDPRYFAPIYEKYFDQIFLFIIKRVDDEEITGDITSKVFLNCLKNIDKYKFRGVPFSAWLYRIALNEVNQYFRQAKKRERVVSMESRHINVLFEEMQFTEREEQPEEIVARLLETLLPEEVQFLELRFFESRSFREIGFLIGISEVNAKVKTYRILKKLRLRAGELKLIK